MCEHLNVCLARGRVGLAGAVVCELSNIVMNGKVIYLAAKERSPALAPGLFYCGARDADRRAGRRRAGSGTR